MGSKNTGQGTRPITRQITRRRFLKALAGGAVGLAATGVYAWRVEPHWVAVERVDLPVPQRLAHWRGRKIVQVSDLHVGKHVDDDYLRDCFDRVAALEPDLLLITGDFMTCHADEQVEHVAEVLRSLPAAKLGRFGISGNHDYGDSWRSELAADRLTDALAKLDIRMLRNELEMIDGLPLIGVDDLWSVRYRPEEVLPKVAAEPFALAMCHNPDGVDRAEWQSFKGWVLAGHTHGGQCRIPLVGAPIVPVLNKHYVAGIYPVGEDRTLYVNRGLGHSLRVRFDARPEITVFTVT